MIRRGTGPGGADPAAEVVGTSDDDGRFEVRADASLIHYSWSFRYDTNDDDKADGGSDLIERIGLSVGYVY